MSPARRLQLQLLGQARNDFQASVAKSRSGFWQAGAAGRQNPRGERQGTGDESIWGFLGVVCLHELSRWRWEQCVSLGAAA